MAVGKVPSIFSVRRAGTRAFLSAWPSSLMWKKYPPLKEYRRTFVKSVTGNFWTSKSTWRWRSDCRRSRSYTRIQSNSKSRVGTTTHVKREARNIRRRPGPTRSEWDRTMGSNPFDGHWSLSRQRKKPSYSSRYRYSSPTICWISGNSTRTEVRGCHLHMSWKLQDFSWRFSLRFSGLVAVPNDG